VKFSSQVMLYVHAISERFFDRERDFRDFEFRRSRDLFLSLDFRSRERFDRDLRRERLRFLDFDLDFDLSDEVTLSPRAILSFLSFDSFLRSDHDRINFPRLGDLIGDFRRRSDGSVETDDDETEDSLELDDTLDDLDPDDDLWDEPSDDEEEEEDGEGLR